MQNRTRSWFTLLLTMAALAVVTSGCAQVSPWERDLLARRDMSWEPDSLEAKRESHIYFSKEASMPGGSGGGGGCGCN
jgi:hypothetical protein